jgi:ketosteroid isomerase-like protein
MMASMTASAVHSALAAEPAQTAAQAEFMFAEAAKQSGARTAFLNWFANDGVMCTPAVENALETVAKWPEAKDSLEWYPSQSYTASSNDMGYTMGPWTYRSADGKQEVFGTVLSVWRKQPDHSWRVVLDCGVHHPKPASVPKPLDLTTQLPAAQPESPFAEWIEPVARAESMFADAVAKSGLPTALKAFAVDDVRVLYVGAQTAETLSAASALLTEKPVGKTFQHVYTNQSRDGSLGYAWGYVGNSKAANATAAYVNVWRKSSRSKPWKIVAQTYQPLPQK